MQKETYERCGRRKCFYLLFFVVAPFLLSLCWYSTKGTARHSQVAIFCYPQTSIRTSDNPSRLDLLEDVSLERMLYEKPNALKPPHSLHQDYSCILNNREDIHTHFRCNQISSHTSIEESLSTASTLQKSHPRCEPGENLRYTVFLKTFIETAEKFFMVGHKVNYYVFTDRTKEMPNVTLADGRQLVVLEVPSYQRWQDVTMRRMEMIRDYSQKRFIKEVDYLVCVDVDMRFTGEVGVEILSDVYGTIHPGYFGAPRKQFTYERRKSSSAYIPLDEGDFYYAGGNFGGTVEEVYKLTNFCHNEMMTDKGNNIEAVWHDESYLNKYFLYHKPTKVLSPEYIWNDYYGNPEVLKKIRFIGVPKNYKTVRFRRALYDCKNETEVS